VRLQTRIAALFRVEYLGLADTGALGRVGQYLYFGILGMVPFGDNTGVEPDRPFERDWPVIALGLDDSGLVAGSIEVCTSGGVPRVAGHPGIMHEPVEGGVD